MIRKKTLGPFIFLCALLLFPLPVFALSQLVISSPKADGVYLLQATNLDGVSALDISIYYDPATLNSPRIEMGSLVKGTMNAANPGNPIRIAVLSQAPLKGSGTVATITFDRPAGLPGAITDLKGVFLDINQKRVTPQAVIMNPAQPTDSSNSDQRTQSGQNSQSSSTVQDGSGATNPQGGSQTGTTPAGYRPVVLGGSVSLPDQGATKEKENPPAPTQQETAERQGPGRDSAASVPTAGGNEPAASKPAAQPAPTPKRFQSVLERFRLFKGEKTPAALIALFTKGSAATFSQTPAIAIADGRSSVTLAISGVPGDGTPNFTFHGAKFVSLSHTGYGDWEVEARPEPGVIEASIGMLLHGVSQEYPLTVAPKAEVLLTKMPEVGESDFIVYLKELGTPADPKYDLNGDRKRDYIDDYIFTANYLVRIEVKAQKKKTVQQRQ